jgi:hypothetical protein
VVPSRVLVPADDAEEFGFDATVTELRPEPTAGARSDHPAANPLAEAIAQAKSMLSELPHPTFQSKLVEASPNWWVNVDSIRTMAVQGTQLHIRTGDGTPTTLSYPSNEAARAAADRILRVAQIPVYG